MQAEQKTRRKLNQGQLDVLILLYKFRFGTTALLARSLGLKDGTYINSRLSILVEQRYVGRNYNSSYKLQGRPASYYLLPKAFQILKLQKEVTPKVLKNIYKDKGASERFVNHNLAVFSASDKLTTLYGNRVEFFTKSDLSLEVFDYFPQSLPDAFITFKRSDSPRARNKYFFLDIFEDSSPFFVTARKVKQYLDYAENGDWGETGSKLPVNLVICESAALQKRLQKRFINVLEDMEDDFMMYTTTKYLFESCSIADDDIWRSVTQPSATLSLNSI